MVFVTLLCLDPDNVVRFQCKSCELVDHVSLGIRWISEDYKPKIWPILSKKDQRHVSLDKAYACFD